MTVEIQLTADGSLRMDAAVAETFFPNGVLVPLRKGAELWLLPTRGAAAGGLLLKQSTAAGDRSVLLRGVLDEPVTPGRRSAAWDAAEGALRVAVDLPP